MANPGALAPASFTFLVSRPPLHGAARNRKPQYLPATAQSIKIAIVLVDGSAPAPVPSPTIATIGLTAPGCSSTSGAYTCTVTLGLPIGSDTLLIQGFDAAGATGNLLSQQRSAFTVAQGSANNFSMTLDASPGPIVLTPPLSGAICSGSPLVCAVSSSPLSFTVTVADAHGTPLADSTFAGSPALSATSSDTTIATVGATQSPYGIRVTPTGLGTATITLTASPATVSSALAPTILAFTITTGPLVTTLAGSTSAGNADGTGAAATFNTPQGLAVDAAGNVYVADTSNHEIRKITPAGVVSTLAGNGASGHADGTGPAASFSNPGDVAVDTAGNVYVADYGNNEVRKVTSAGVVTTLAGSTTGGYVDATGPAARFSLPNGVAVDTAGNVYVADENNNKIRKVTPAGVVSTLAGSGPGHADGTPGSFHNPTGVAVDATGNVYVGDLSNDEIRKVTPAGVVSTLAGTTVAGHADGTPGSFSFPFEVAVDTAGNVYVGDFFNNEIRKVSAAGGVTTLAGSTTSGNANGTGALARFNHPSGVAVDARGNVYVADYSNNEICTIAP